MEENTNNQENLLKIIAQYEETLSWKRSGSIEDRVDHVCGQYKSIADNSIFECKRVMEDVKTQFKALEMVVEGLSSDGMNHGQKRVIANHIITMLRSMVDRIDQYEYEYTTTHFERYNFFRSNTPERRLRESHREFKQKSEAQDKVLKTLKEVHPDIYKSLTSETDGLPF